VRQEQNCGPPSQIIWRFRLEYPRTERQQLFADAKTLIYALQAIDAMPEEKEKPACR